MKSKHFLSSSTLSSVLQILPYLMQPSVLKSLMCPEDTER